MPSKDVTPAKCVYIALGSNLGERLANLRAALAALPPKISLLRASPVYETDPWGYLDQPAYLNQVVEVQTSLSPEAVLERLKQIEREMGRQPTFRFGPRLIDLDILFYDDLIIDSPPLQVPHPRLAERAFVLAPLADLVPSLRHPILGLTIQELLQRVDSTCIRLYRPTIPPLLR